MTLVFAFARSFPLARVSHGERYGVGRTLPYTLFVAAK
jgi:hypothetical protein